jgi:hypothetical protein
VWFATEYIKCPFSKKNDLSSSQHLQVWRFPDKTLTSDWYMISLYNKIAIWNLKFFRYLRADKTFWKTFCHHFWNRSNLILHYNSIIPSELKHVHECILHAKPNQTTELFFTKKVFFAFSLARLLTITFPTALIRSLVIATSLIWF